VSIWFNTRYVIMRWRDEHKQQLNTSKCITELIRCQMLQNQNWIVNPVIQYKFKMVKANNSVLAESWPHANPTMWNNVITVRTPQYAKRAFSLQNVIRINKKNVKQFLRRWVIFSIHRRQHSEPVESWK